MTAVERRVLSFFKRLQNREVDWIDVEKYPNVFGTIRQIRKALPEYPACVLSRGRFLMKRTDRLRNIAITLIWRLRRRCNLWFEYTRKAVLFHLREQFEIEYELGLRNGPSQSEAKAEAAIYEAFPTIARMSVDDASTRNFSVTSNFNL